jgi:hypothetical protein
MTTLAVLAVSSVQASITTLAVTPAVVQASITTLAVTPAQEGGCPPARRWGSP